MSPNVNNPTADNNRDTPARQPPMGLTQTDSASKCGIGLQQVE